MEATKAKEIGAKLAKTMVTRVQAKKATIEKNCAEKQPWPILGRRRFSNTSELSPVRTGIPAETVTTAG